MHLISSVITGPAASGLIVLGVLNLFQGIFVWVFAAILAGWTWLSIAAFKAHGSLRGLEESGHIVRGTVLEVVRAPSGCTVTYTYDVEMWSEAEARPTGDARTWTASTTGLTLWKASRYQESMRVAVLLDPMLPSEGILYPAPGGGAPLDLLGDCIAWLIQRFIVHGGGSSKSPPHESKQSAPPIAHTSGEHKAATPPPREAD